MLDLYPADARIWLPDADLGWIGGKVLSRRSVKAGSFEISVQDDRGKVQSQSVSEEGISV